MEARVDPRDDLKIFVSGKLNADLAYPLLSSDSEWKDKKFDQSRSKLFVLDRFEDLLSEAHVTWSPGQSFSLRLGKQIVSWGETDGVRLVDQINPVDQRRGFADVKFESTIIPIWLAKAEYFPPINTDWLRDVGLELVFNPNAQFIADKSVVPGNDAAGVWAPYVTIPLGGTFPNDFGYLGSLDQKLSKPRNWDSKGFEYAARLKGHISNTLVTLSYFDGIANSPVTQATGNVRMETAHDGRAILHPEFTGYFPDFKFVGFTMTRDFESLNASALGGVAPVLRLESLYAFNSSFSTSNNTIEKFDEFRWAAGVDWKIKVGFLNPRAYFTISPQYIQQYVLKYPGNFSLTGVTERSDIGTLLVSTSYFHNKFTPMVFLMRDFTNNANFWKLQGMYEYSDKWNFTLGTLLFQGADTGKGFEPFKNKDQVYTTLSYKF